MRQMQQDMDNAFARFFREETTNPLLADPNNTPTRYKNPLVDVIEEDGKLIATIDLPGVNKKDIEVDIDEEKITVSAKREQKAETNQEGVYRLERRYAGFKRTIPLREGVRPEQATANYQDGVLRIEVPVEEKNTTKKRLTIK